MVIGLVVAGVWVSLMVIAVALCRVAGGADELTVTSYADREVVRAKARGRASAPAAGRESSPRAVLSPR
jgi:hypothetical protein